MKKPNNLKRPIIIVIATAAICFSIVAVFIFIFMGIPIENLEDKSPYVGVFDDDQLNAMLGKENGSIRFYNSLEVIDGPQSVVSVVVNERGCDISPDGSESYIRAGEVKNSSVRYEPLNREQLARERSSLGGEKFPAFHITLSRETIESLLKPENALAFAFGITRDGLPTFEVYKGYILGSTFIRISRLRDQSEPCPIACPPDDSPNCYVR